MQAWFHLFSFPSFFFQFPTSSFSSALTPQQQQQQQQSPTSDFLVSSTPSRLTTTTSNNISLVCISNAKPILCLWKTPYGHIYTLSEGVFAESGRLRHLSSSSSSGDRSSSSLQQKDHCGLEIIGVQQRDKGRWECEVGAVIQEDFRTKTDHIFLDVKSKAVRAPSIQILIYALNTCDDMLLTVIGYWVVYMLNS